MRLVSICWFHFWFCQVSIVVQINGVYVDGCMDEWMDGWMTPIMLWNTPRYNQLTPPTTVIDTPVVVWPQPR
jgi:hypothetical protein